MTIQDSRALQELGTVNAYLMDYARNNALTDEEFHLVQKMLKDVSKKYNSIVFSWMTTEEIACEHRRRVEARRQNK